LSEIKTLLHQSSHYFTGQIIIMAAGFISFPILTRIFSVGDYGVLGIITTTVLIATAVAKLGLPGWIVQFYAQFKLNQRLDTFQSTILITSAGCAATIAILFYVLGQLFRGEMFEKNIVSLIPIVSMIIFTGCTSDILTSFLRAEQRTKLYNLVAIIRRYGTLTLGILLALFIIKGLYGFYFGQVLTGIVVLSFLIFISAKRQKISLRNFSTWVFKDSIRFGLPMVGGEMGHLILNYADRYLIQVYLGSISLGLYIAGYNLSTYVTEMFMYPINYAMTPIYMNILVKKGEEETKKFFTRAFRYFLMIMVAVVFGFIAIGKDLIGILASSKYLEAYSVLPYVVIGQSIYACSIILNNGLFIRKKTHVVMYVISVACLLNIGLNLILIPRFGILGAAQATLISNTFYTIVITYFAFKEFRFEIDYPHILLYGFIAAAMYLVIGLIDRGSPFANLVTKIPVGVVFYAIGILALDSDVRSAIVRLISRSGTPKFPLH
jgi:O-antigen/teichoic acid export membrane protein